MADRPPQSYSMMPPGYNNLLQQQQAQQQQAQQQQAQQQQQLQQQQQQLDSHPGPGFPNVWPQQMQQPFRPRSGAGMTPTQSQMNELMMRNQNMARAQGTQQMPFNMGVGVPNMGGQQAFHDQSSNQPPNGNMAGGFPSLGMLNPNMNAAPQQQQQQQRNLLQGLPASGQRQLDMMLAHNPNFMKFGAHPQIPQRPDQSQPQQQQQQQPFVNTGMNHSSPGDLFASAGMPNPNEAIRRGSPSHPPNMIAAMPGTMGSNQPAQQRRVPLSIPELQERANQLRLSIQNEENVIHTIRMQANMNGGQIPVEHQQRLSQLQTAVNLKKEYLSKIVQSLSVQNPQGPPQQANGPGGVGWVGNPQSFDNAAQRAKAASLQQSQTPQAIAQGLAKPQTPVNHPINAGGLPPRSDQQQLTPQHGPGQQPGGLASSSSGPFQVGPMGMNGQHPFAQGAGRSTPQMPNAVAGGMALNFGTVINLAQQLLSTISPLDRPRFEQAFKNWCSKKNIPVDSNSLQMEGRTVDLHNLHHTVFREGGFRKIEQTGSWDVVAGKMGFVAFPGSEGQPPKSGPVVAHNISVNYKDYLQDFDTAYISNQLEQKNKESGHPSTPNPNQIAMAITGGKPLGAQVNGNGQPGQPGQQMDVRAPNQMSAQLMSLAHRTVPELRSMGAPDHMISFIEGNRAALQRAHQDQVNRSGTLAGQQPLHPSNGEQQGNSGAPSGPQPPPFGVVSGGQGVPGPSQDRRLLGQSVAGGFSPAVQGISGPLGAQLPQHQQQQVPSLQGGQHPGQGQQNMMLRGGKEQLLQTAIALVGKWKTEFMNTKIHNLPPCEVRADQRAQYNALLEQLFRMTTELDQKLPLIYCIMRNDDFVRRCIEIGITVGFQRTLVSSSNPRLIVSLETLQKMMPEVHRMREQANSLFIRDKTSQQQPHFQQQPMHLQHQQPQQQQPVGGMPPPGHMLQDIPRPPMPSQPPPSSIPAPQGQQQQTTPHLSASQLRPPPSLNPPPGRRNPKPPHAGSALTPKVMQSPSPAAAASTPPSAPTPSAMVASPQAPKSPKPKTTPKPKPATTKPRRQSKAMAQSPAAGGSASAATPQSQASPEALSTPVQANASIKRPRDEEPSGPAGPSPGSSGDMNGVANGPSPPKRAKMEPSEVELPLSDNTPLDKKPDMSSQITHIKTDEDASQFFMDRFQELIDTTANTDGQEALASGITETLSMLLKGCGPTEGGEASGSGFGSDLSNAHGRETPPPASLFDEFFDFSNIPDEEDTKVDTPELVSSSSTNPSPESNISESDIGGLHHLSGVSTSLKTDPKLEDVSDSVRLGTWKEIDGGEASYYQSNEWKWEGSMNTFDHPWAIFNQ